MINYLFSVLLPHLRKQEELLIHCCSFCQSKYSLELLPQARALFSAGRPPLKSHRSPRGPTQDPREPFSGCAQWRKEWRLTDVITGFKIANSGHSWAALLSSVWQSYEQKRRNSAGGWWYQSLATSRTVRKFSLAVKVEEIQPQRWHMYECLPDYTPVEPNSR